MAMEQATRPIVEDEFGEPARGEKIEVQVLRIECRPQPDSRIGMPINIVANDCHNRRSSPEVISMPDSSSIRKRVHDLEKNELVQLNLGAK